MSVDPGSNVARSRPAVRASPVTVSITRIQFGI